MAEITIVSNEKWTSAQAYSIAIVCLLLGLAGGWFIRSVQAPTEDTQVVATQAAISNQASTAQASLPTPPHLQQVQLTAETQAAPLVAQLKSPTMLLGSRILAIFITTLSNTRRRLNTTSEP